MHRSIAVNGLAFRTSGTRVIALSNLTVSLPSYMITVRLNPFGSGVPDESDPIPVLLCFCRSSLADNSAVYCVRVGPDSHAGTHSDPSSATYVNSKAKPDTHPVANSET